MKTHSTFLITIAVAGACFLTARADLITLRDGRTISGAVSRDGDTMLIRPADGTPPITTTPDQIASVTLSTSLTPEQAAQSEWTRTEALIRKAPDIPAIIALHEAFLQKFPDRSSSSKVRVSLAQYKKLATENAIKFHGSWMSPEQVDALRRTWREQAGPSLEQYRARQMRQALDSAQAVIHAHPDNPDALVIAGLAAFHLNNLAAATNHFSALAQADPVSALAENNLAVIAFQQKLYARALIHYAKALPSAPDNRLLLDNIQAALAVYLANKGDKQNPCYRDLVSAVQEPEARLEALMAKKKLHRFGSAWIPVADYARIAAADTAIRNAMGRLDAAYNANVQETALLNDQIQQAISDYNTTLSNINMLNAGARDAATRSDTPAAPATPPSPGPSPPAGTSASSVVTGGWSRRHGPAAPATGSLPNDPAALAAAQEALPQIAARRSALQERRDQIALAAIDMRGQAEKLKAQFNALETPAPGIQQMMELDAEVLSDPVTPPQVVALLASLPQQEPPPPATQPQSGRTYKNDIPTPVEPVQPIATGVRPRQKSSGGAWGSGLIAGDAGPYGATLTVNNNGVPKTYELAPGHFSIVDDPVHAIPAGTSESGNFTLTRHSAPVKNTPPSGPPAPKAPRAPVGTRVPSRR